MRLRIKTILCLFAVCTTCIFTGCSNDSDKQSVSATQTDSSEQEDTEITTQIITATEDTTVEPIKSESVKVVYTSDARKKLEENLAKLHTVSVEEKITNGLSNDSAKTEVSNHIDIDTAHGICIASIDSHTFADRLTDNEDEELHLSVDTSTNTWVEDEGYSTSLVGWNIKKFGNAKDVYETLTTNIPLEIGTEGVSTSGVDTFTSTTDATSDDLQGIDYDSLKTKTVTYIFKDNLPVSVITEITFSKDDVDYKTQVVFMFEFSDKELQMPSVNDKYKQERQE